MSWEIKHGDWIDVLREMSDESAQCCVTSPPYWGLRDYGVPGQLGLERTPDEYVAKVVEGFREVRRVLRKDGTLWLNLGDSYCGPNGRSSGGTYNSTIQDFGAGTIAARNAPMNRTWNDGMKPKDLCGIPWMVAFALRADGWYLRQDIIWAKPNPMPESVTDRCTKAHEYLFLMTKSARYYFDADAIAQPCVTAPDCKSAQSFGSKNGKCSDSDLAHAADPGHKWEYSETRNRRSVWEITTTAFPEAHFATFPPKLVEPCILAGCPEGGTVLDPFAGAGTTGLVATRLHRNFIGIELNADYIAMARNRITSDAPLFNGAGA